MKSKLILTACAMLLCHDATAALRKFAKQPAAPAQPAAPEQPAAPAQPGESHADRANRLEGEVRQAHAEIARLRHELHQGQAKSANGCVADKVAKMDPQHVANAAVTLIHRADLTGVVDGPGAEAVIAAVNGQQSHMLGRLGKPAAKKRRFSKHYAH